jgi:hypothetical protein
VRGSRCAFQIRCTERKEMPAAFAIIRPVQCVVSPGGSSRVSSTTRSTVDAGSGGMPGLRVLSRRRPGTPSRMKRSCQRQTHGLLLPVRRTIARVPSPSAVATTILARQACF